MRCCHEKSLPVDVKRDGTHIIIAGVGHRLYASVTEMHRMQCCCRTRDLSERECPGLSAVVESMVKYTDRGAACKCIQGREQRK